MVRSFLKILSSSLSVCDDTTAGDGSVTTSAESMENGRNGHITMRCFAVLLFWIAIATLLAAVLLYGSPRLWTALGSMVSASSLR